MTGIKENKYPASYLNEIKNGALKRMDTNGDGKVNVDEAFKSLDIASLISGQDEKDAQKIKAAAKQIPEVLAKYAGNDKQFSAEEWADFLNGKEWDTVMDAWHSSGVKAKLEMEWTDNAHHKDGSTTKGEVKAGLFNSAVSKLKQTPSGLLQKINDIVEKYVGDDGIFSLTEYMQMKNDPEYKQLQSQYNMYPWFKYE